jgi:hypothetical protein
MYPEVRKLMPDLEETSSSRTKALKKAIDAIRA